MQGAAGAQPQELSWMMHTSYIGGSDTTRGRASQQAAQVIAAHTLDIATQSCPRN